MFARICLSVFVLSIFIKPAYAELPFKVKARAALLVNAVSGQVIFEQNPDKKIPPASLTKLMTLYLAFDAVDDKLVALTDKVRISKKAWKTGGSKMFLEVNSEVPLKTLLKGIAVVSANDACVAVAEHIAGVEEVFVEKMNRKALSIGMVNTVFKNSHGLPSDGQYTTVRDMAMLACHYLKDHPGALKNHSSKEMTFNNITQKNRNGLLWVDDSVDGLKTGWFSSAGYHIVTTAFRNGDRFISVVMGAKGETQRENAALKLLNYAFRNFKTIKISDEKTRAETDVWYGTRGKVLLGTSQEIYITIPIDKKGELYVEKQFPEKIYAPIQKAQEIGHVRIMVEGEVLKNVPLVSLESIEPAGFVKKILHGITLFFILPPYMGIMIIFLFLMILVFVRIVISRKKKEKRKRRETVSDLDGFLK